MDPFSGATVKGFFGSSESEKRQGRQLEKAMVILRKQAAEAKDSIGVIRASAGLQELSQRQIDTINSSFNTLGQIDELSQDLEKFRDTSFLESVIASRNPFDAAARGVNARLIGIVPGLARGTFGEVGVLTDTDVERYKTLLPTLTDTKDVQKVLLSTVLRTVQRSMEDNLKITGRGRDVSAYAQDVEFYRQRADELLAEAEAGSAGLQAESAAPEAPAAKTQFSAEDLIGAGLQDQIDAISLLPVDQLQ